MKRWEDTIKEWTGVDVASSTRAAENTTRWKRILVNSSVVPERPSKIMGLNRTCFQITICERNWPNAGLYGLFPHIQVGH